MSQKKEKKKTQDRVGKKDKTKEELLTLRQRPVHQQNLLASRAQPHHQRPPRIARRPQRLRVNARHRLRALRHAQAPAGRRPHHARRKATRGRGGAQALRARQSRRRPRRARPRGHAAGRRRPPRPGGQGRSRGAARGRLAGGGPAAAPGGRRGRLQERRSGAEPAQEGHAGRCGQDGAREGRGRVRRHQGAVMMHQKTTKTGSLYTGSTGGRAALLGCFSCPPPRPMCLRPGI